MIPKRNTNLQRVETTQADHKRREDAEFSEAGTAPEVTLWTWWKTRRLGKKIGSIILVLYVVLPIAVIPFGTRITYWGGPELEASESVAVVYDDDGGEVAIYPEIASCNHGKCNWIGLKDKQLVEGVSTGHQRKMYKARFYLGTSEMQGEEESDDPNITWNGIVRPFWVLCYQPIPLVSYYLSEEGPVDHNPRIGTDWRTEIIDFTADIPEPKKLPAAIYSSVCHGDSDAYKQSGFASDYGYKSPKDALPSALAIEQAPPYLVWMQKIPIRETNVKKLGKLLSDFLAADNPEYAQDPYNYFSQVGDANPEAEGD